MEPNEDKVKSRCITSRRISKFKRKYGDIDRNMEDVLRKPTLTHRDKDVLLSIYYQRCLTTRQIAEMHYKYSYKGKENSQSELIARRRLRSMFDSQLIDRFYVDVGNEGSSQGHIVLDQLGAKVVAGLLNLNVADLTWSYEMNEARLPYLEHMIDTNNFYIYLLRKARELGHEVTGFRTETHCRHDFKFWGQHMVCNPDAYGQYWFRNEQDVEEGIHFFLEWDNGTMSPQVFQKKHQRYTAYYGSGEYVPVYKEFPLILVVVPDIIRVEQLHHVIYAVDNTDLQWLFATREDVETNPLGKIWLGRGSEVVSLL
jgi:hypothetical protein